MRLVNKIFLSFFGIIVFGGLMSTIIGALLVSRSLRAEAFSRVQNDLKSARLFIYDHVDELSIASQILSDGLLWEGDLPGSPDLSFVFNEEDRVFRSYLEKEAGSLFPANQGVITIPLTLLQELGFDLSKIDQKALYKGNKTMWLFSTHSGRHGDAFTGTLISGNERIIALLQDTLFERLLYGKKPFYTVTIFCGDTRVATTVIGPSGEIALGTKVSDVVKQRVLDEGGIWLDRAYVVDDWYLSAYEPIKSPAGKNVGILYVGVLEKKYLDVNRRAILLLSAINIPTLGLLVFGVFLLSKSIVRPVTKLAKASGEIADGKLDTEVVDTSRTTELQTLSKSFNVMAHAIMRREEMLVQKNKELEEANRDYQELLSFVTHELNNSIGSLLLNVSILIDGTVGEFTGEQNEVIALVLRDVERFRDMVRNYLNISRLEKGTLKHRPEVIDLRQSVVEPMLKRLQGRINHKGMKVLWDWEREVVLKADADLLDICYSNLIVNAIKYGKEWIRFSVEKEDEYWVLGVHNGGSLIPVENIPLLFQKFSRLVKSDDGAGLGLYLIRKIVERHGGEVYCTSEEYKGTSFYMKLPAS